MGPTGKGSAGGPTTWRRQGHRAGLSSPCERPRSTEHGLEHLGHRAGGGAAPVSVLGHQVGARAAHSSAPAQAFRKELIRPSCIRSGERPVQTKCSKTKKSCVELMRPHQKLNTLELKRPNLSLCGLRSELMRPVPELMRPPSDLKRPAM